MNNYKHYKISWIADHKKLLINETESCCNFKIRNNVRRSDTIAFASLGIWKKNRLRRVLMTKVRTAACLSFVRKIPKSKSSGDWQVRSSLITTITHHLSIRQLFINHKQTRWKCASCNDLAKLIHRILRPDELAKGWVLSQSS